MTNIVGITSLSKKIKGVLRKELVRNDRGYFFEFNLEVENPFPEINTVPKTPNAKILCIKKI